MNFKKRKDGIVKALKSHKQTIDDLNKKIEADRKAYYDSLDSRKNELRAEYIAESKRSWRPNPNYKKIADTSRASALESVNRDLALIRNSFDQYFQTPPSEEFTRILLTAKLTGRTLSATEYELLTRSATNYAERMALSSLAENSTDDAYSKIVAKNKTDKDMPDITEVYRVLNNLESQCRFALNNYSGLDLNNRAFFVDDSEKIGKDSLRGVWMANADTFMEKLDKSPSFTDAMNLGDQMNKFSHGIDEKDNVLTDAEKNLIDTLVDPKYPWSAQDSAVSISLASADLAKVFMKDSRYHDAVAKALDL